MDASLHPRHRTDNLAMSAFDGELLVQDTKRHRAHALNAQAAAVFRLADGTHTVEELAVLASAQLGEPMTPEAVWYALGLLQRLHLLEEPVVAKEDRITRKVLLKRAGAAVALASIASITIPAAGAHASSCANLGSSCQPSLNPCCNGQGKCICTTGGNSSGFCTAHAWRCSL